MSTQVNWYGKLPSGSPGIARIRLLLELMLHVRMRSPEEFELLAADVRELAEREDVLLDGIMAGRDRVEGFEAQQAWRARGDHHCWDDLLFVLSEYGVLEPTADERERWDESLAELRDRLELIDELRDHPDRPRYGEDDDEEEAER